MATSLSESEDAKDLLQLHERLLKVTLPTGNYDEYAAGCDPTITCFEPEAKGYLVKGLEFHKYYFPSSPTDISAICSNTTIVDPSVRILAGGQSAVVAYTRLVQRPGGITTSTNETRVYEKQDGKWISVHIHRSDA